MVDSIKSTSGTMPLKNAAYKPGSATTAVSPIGDKESHQSQSPKVDRRKKKDRRLQYSSKHPKFEMRRSSGRRSEDREQPSIEVKA